MQGLADLQNNLGKHKKKIYSVTLVVLLVFSGLLGAFIQFKDSINVGANPATYIYFENFEDVDTSASGYVNDTVGIVVNDTNPDANWYNSTVYNISGFTSNYSVSDYGVSASQGLTFIADGGSAMGYLFELNTTGDADVEYCNISFIKQDTAGTQKVYISFTNLSYDTEGTHSLVNSYSIAKLRWDGTADKFQYCNSVGVNTDIDDYIFNDWGFINISLNYTTDKFQVHYDTDGTPGTTSWLDSMYGNDIDGIHYIVLWHDSGEYINFTIDNIILGSNTDLGGGGGGGYPNINATAFNASLPTTVSGNHSLTFDNDTGSPCWSNSSGTTNETMNISIIDGNSSVTFINISMFNLSDGSGHYINADKLYLYVYNDSAASWVNKSNFPTNGGNISLDNTDTDIGVTWPIAGDATLLCRFKLVIPGGTTEAVYTQTTLCGVYIGG